MTVSLYDEINCLAEFIIIGGDERTLNFTVYDENGTPVSLNSATCVWKLAEYGLEDYAVVTKAGVVTGSNTWKIDLEEADTILLSGKYIQQPLVTEASGKTHPSYQGTIIILPRIP